MAARSRRQQHRSLENRRPRQHEDHRGVHHRPDAAVGAADAQDSGQADESAGKLITVQASVEPSMHGTYLRQEECPGRTSRGDPSLSRPGAPRFEATFSGRLEYSRRSKFGYYKNQQTRLILQSVQAGVTRERIQQKCEKVALFLITDDRRRYRDKMLIAPANTFFCGNLCDALTAFRVCLDLDALSQRVNQHYKAFLPSLTPLPELSVHGLP